MGLDYYAILDIPRESSEWDIKLAYRNLALLLHPKREKYQQHPNVPPEGVFELPLPDLPENIYWDLINEAFDVLRNPLLRAIYDQYGEEGLKKGTPVPNGFIPGYCYHNDSMKTYHEVFGSFSPYCDLIDAATNPPNLYSVKEGIGLKNKDPTVERLLYLDLKEVFHGGVKTIKMLRHEFVDPFKNKTEVKEVILTVPIAPGIFPGTRLIFPEVGDQGPTRIPADIIFITCDKPHGIFKRKNSDLHMSHKIILKDALIGFKLTLETIDDRKLEILVTDVIE